MGISLEQLKKMTALNPAKVLTISTNKGSLKLGADADISILEMKEGEFVFDDGKDKYHLMGDTFVNVF
jgi:formylmethanofuran dehydrogenase subunit A